MSNLEAPFLSSNKQTAFLGKVTDPAPHRLTKGSFCFELFNELGAGDYFLEESFGASDAPDS